MGEAAEGSGAAGFGFQKRVELENKVDITDFIVSILRPRTLASKMSLVHELQHAGVRSEAGFKLVASPTHFISYRRSMAWKAFKAMLDDVAQDFGNDGL